jgi:hypothetical protein
MRIVTMFLTLALTASLALAQQSVPPPPQPANDAPANAEILMLLRAGMPESVVLDKIHAITGKFDTSTNALITLKQAGATEAELKAVMAQGALPAEQPPAAAPTDSGPSLAESLQFIQEKLNDLGKVTFAEFQSKDNVDYTTGIETKTSEISNVVADQNQCRISYHLSVTISPTPEGTTYRNESSVFSLRNVQEIVIRPYEQYETEWLAKNAQPDWIVRSTSPPMMALIVRQPHGVENVFEFIDANLADRVAKAMLHAVELCGGGSKPEMF